MKLQPEEFQTRFPRHVLMDGYANLLDLNLVERFAFAWHKMVEGRPDPIPEGHYRAYYIDEKGRVQCEDWWPSQLTEHVYSHKLLLYIGYPAQAPPFRRVLGSVYPSAWTVDKASGAWAGVLLSHVANSAPLYHHIRECTARHPIGRLI